MEGMAELRGQHGNEDTFRDMLRVRRSVQATYAQVHFNATEIAAEAEAEVLDPMKQAEEELQADKKRKAGGAAGGDAKRMRAGGDANVARKELMGGFEPSDSFKGARPGFVFKLGVKGLGYYEDASSSELEARAARERERERQEAVAARQTAEANPEEIELDMDDDEEIPPGGTETPPARPASNNPEEIDLDLDVGDIETAQVPASVLGGSLSTIRAAMPAEEEIPEEDEPDAPQADAGSQGALARFQRKGKGKGKKGGRGSNG